MSGAPPAPRVILSASSAQAAETRRLREMMRVEAALRRLDHGGYGYCLTCGGAIGAERLSLDPAISLCISCEISAKGR